MEYSSLFTQAKTSNFVDINVGSFVDIEQAILGIFRTLRELLNDTLH